MASPVGSQSPVGPGPVTVNVVDHLEGRTAVVTGAGSGIGRAIGLELAGAGMHVVVADIEEEKADAVAGEIAATGVRSLAVGVDVADAGSVAALADTAFAEFGAVHLLCNNAGVLLFKGFAVSIIEDWQWVRGVNVMGVLNGVSAFLPRLLEQDDPSHIVNTSSIAALAASDVYGTSKAAILSLTDALAEELADSKVGVSALLPGVVSTQIVAAERNRPETMGRKTDEPAKAFAGQFGFDPSTCATRLREGVVAGDRYIWAGVPADWDDIGAAARARLDAILAALPEGIVEE